ncbi:MAG: metal-sensing transcriptional repressor [Proteobacteria bacterium]|nr:metal-sensing transcriptional repressor [Pseudomonadota bacterium]MBS0598847.1 metal-sensing transcriptional repressor [Pseudomonadota bacterium]
MALSKIHHTHPAVLKRLTRAEGQLRSIRAMIEAGRPCLEIAQQLQAAASAVHVAKKTFINDHLDHCLDHAVDGSGQGSRLAMDEFKAITKYL